MFRGWNALPQTMPMRFFSTLCVSPSLNVPGDQWMETGEDLEKKLIHEGRKWRHNSRRMERGFWRGITEFRKFFTTFCNWKVDWGQQFISNRKITDWDRMSVDISDLLSQRGLITESIRSPVKIHEKSQAVVLAGYEYSKQLLLLLFKQDQSSEALGLILALLSLQQFFDHFSFLYWLTKFLLASFCFWEGCSYLCSASAAAGIITYPEILEWVKYGRIYGCWVAWYFNAICWNWEWD